MCGAGAADVDAVALWPTDARRSSSEGAAGCGSGGGGATVIVVMVCGAVDVGITAGGGALGSTKPVGVVAEVVVAAAVGPTELTDYSGRLVDEAGASPPGGPDGTCGVGAGAVVPGVRLFSLSRTAS